MTRLLQALRKHTRTDLRRMSRYSALFPRLRKAEKSYKETKVSLNEVTRKKEMEEAEKKKAANDKLNTKIVGKEGTPVDVMEMDDEIPSRRIICFGRFDYHKIRITNFLYFEKAGLKPAFFIFWVARFPH